MKSKIFFSILMLFVLSGICFSQTINKGAVGFVYSFGIKDTKLANGVVVGNGEYVITPTMAVHESFTEKTGHTIEYPMFLSLATGKVYECKTIFASHENNIALLKLSEKIPNNVKISTAAEIGVIPITTMGQISSSDPIITELSAVVTGIDRKKSDKGYENTFVGFKSRYGAQCDEGSVRTVFLCNLGSKTTAPLGSMVTLGRNLLGLFNAIYSYRTQDTVTNQGQVILSQYAIKEIEARKIPFENAKTTYDTGQYKWELLNKYDYLFSALASGATDESVKTVNEILKETPNVPIAYELLGMVYSDAGNVEEAKKAYTKAVELNPNSAFALLYLAELKSLDERIPELEVLAKKFTDDIRVQNALMNAYIKKKDSVNAEKLLPILEKISPDNPNVALNRAKLLLLENNLSDSESVGLKLNVDFPGWYPGLEFLAGLYMSAGNYDKASNYVNQMISASPNDYLPYIYYGEIMLNKGDKKQALDYLEHAKELFPKEKSSESLDKLIKKAKE